jgi:hypothetical protein
MQTLQSPTANISEQFGFFKFVDFLTATFPFRLALARPRFQQEEIQKHQA